jgi:hypothetical protein
MAGAIGRLLSTSVLGNMLLGLRCSSVGVMQGCCSGIGAETPETVGDSFVQALEAPLGGRMFSILGKAVDARI